MFIYSTFEAEVANIQKDTEKQDIEPSTDNTTAVTTDENAEPTTEDADTFPQNGPVDLASKTADEDDTYEFALRNSFMTTSTKGQPTISKIEGPTKLLQAKTSAQLLNMVHNTVLDDQEKINTFISQLKTGEVQTKGGTGFRQRRLTYSQHTVNESPHEVSPPKIQPKTTRAARTTIFASSEIGVVQEKKPPFPKNAMGTYSCHGIEPSEEEEDGIKLTKTEDV
jgi:hypothetical protein